jgi:hypothetical protein
MRSVSGTATVPCDRRSSCKTRFCPSCHAKKLTLWSDRLVEQLLEDVPHRMITLTVPKRIRPFFLWERKLLGLLARCAADTIKQFYRHMLQEPRGRPGIVASIQTFGNQAANYHPHIHCLVADGLFLSDGSFRSASLIAPLDIAELFRREVLKAFVEQELIPQEVAETMLTWPHSGFNVHIGPRLLPDDGDTLVATARYAARAPISLQRLHYEGGKERVTYAYTSAYDRRERVAELSPREFIARLMTHIPGRYERLIRYYGVYSSRSTRSSRTSDPGRSIPGRDPSPSRRHEAQGMKWGIIEKSGR